ARITRAYKLRQQPVEPRERELPGVSFCDGRDDFPPAQRILLECVSRQPHCSNNRSAGRTAGTTNVIISYHVRNMITPQTPNSAEERKRVARLEIEDPDRLITLRDGGGRVVAEHALGEIATASS